MKVSAAAWLLPLVLSSAAAYRFLVVFPMPSSSHSILGKGFVRSLVDAGHEVTHITAVPDKTPHKLVKQIDVSFLFNQLKETVSFLRQAPPSDYSIIKRMAFNISTGMLGSQVVQDLMSDRNQKFDAVITEWFFNELYVGFAQVFQCPWLYFAPAGMLATLEYLVDEVQSPATNPNIMMGFTVPMTFRERLINTFIVYYGLYQTIFQDHPGEAVAYEEMFGAAARARGVPLAPYSAAVHNVSVLLINSHPSLGQPLRLPSNAVEIAGYHIDPNVAPLPQDLQNLLDKEDDGIIYFSMGSNLKSKDMPESIRKELLAMFVRLGRTVLWKFETEMPDAPQNVHVRAWMPQPSILAHKNVKVFITHGGALSTTEALHFGVPIVAVPIFGDQFLNAQRAEKHGFCRTVQYRDPQFVSNLEKALKQIFSESKFGEQARSLSKLFHDRPVPPARLVTYWAEHAVRTRGALHLRSTAKLVPAYQRWMLDIFALVGAAVAIVVFAIVAFIKVLSRIFKRKSVDAGKKKNKKNN